MIGRWKQEYGGGILSIIAGSGWNWESPATEYDHRITASIFLPLSGVFSSGTTTFQWVL
jgi:hypothetical protein